MEQKIYALAEGAIHYWVQTAGPGRPWLVFLPGLTADHRLFEKQLAAFAGRYNCLVWDAPAHGASRPFALRFTLQDWADWLHAILQRETDAPRILVGQSMGGYLAQVYMTCYPQHVQGFVSIDSCPLQRTYYSGWELFLLRHMYGVYAAIPWRLLLDWGTSGCARTPYGRALMRQMMQSYDKTSYCALAAYGYRMLAQAVQAGVSYTIPCPVQLLCGEFDAAGSAKRYNDRWARRTGYPLLWVPQAGHNSNTDAPDFVNQVLVDFVERTLGANR